MVRTTRLVGVGFAITGFLVSIKPESALPVLSTARTSKGFGILGKIFYVGEMVFIEVERVLS